MRPPARGGCAALLGDTREQSSGAEAVARASQDLPRLTQEISSSTEEQAVGVVEIVPQIDAEKRG